jgi:hypothetical protein
MIHDKSGSTRFQDENGEGEVTTKHEHHTVTSFMKGILFKAVVEHRHGTTRCSFLVNDKDIPDEEDVLRDLHWSPVIPFFKK